MTGDDFGTEAPTKEYPAAETMAEAVAWWQRVWTGDPYPDVYESYEVGTR